MKESSPEKQIDAPDGEIAWDRKLGGPAIAIPDQPEPTVPSAAPNDIDAPRDPFAARAVPDVTAPERAATGETDPDETGEIQEVSE